MMTIKKKNSLLLGCFLVFFALFGVEDLVMTLVSAPDTILPNLSPSENPMLPEAKLFVDFVYHVIKLIFI